MFKIIIALVLIAHGIGHSMGLLASWTSVPSGLISGHWVFSNEVVMNSMLGRIFGVIWLLALLGFVGAGSGLWLNQEWWRPLAVASAVTSLIAVLPWINLMPPFSAFGAVGVDLAVLAVLLLPWGDRIIEQIR